LLLEDIDTISVTNARETNHDNSKIRILSLSSILNVIDGVDATEGRVLVMTTKDLNKLDVALTRAGRIDVQIKFDYPSSDSIKRLFQTIYTPSDDENHTPIADTPPEDMLEVLADEFAAAVTGKNLSPADIQCYLLQHKNKPEVAIFSYPT
jgi:chaperone BCS1